jgi:hypothetical protein
MRKGHLRVAVELMKFSRKPASPVDSETENDSDDLSSNDDEPQRRTSSSSSTSLNSSLSTENGYTRNATYRDGSQSRVQQSFSTASSVFEHMEPNRSQSSHSSSSHSHGFNGGGQSQAQKSSSSGSSTNPTPINPDTPAPHIPTGSMEVNKVERSPLPQAVLLIRI